MLSGAFALFANAQSEDPPPVRGAKPLGFCRADAGLYELSSRVGFSPRGICFSVICHPERGPAICVRPSFEPSALPNCLLFPRTPMNLQLDAMSVAMPHVVGHPNRLPFRGVLTLVGTASQRSPSGARGHRVMLTRAAADAALPSLLGMALDYAPSLDAHDARRKIGIITAADIVPIPHSKTSRLAGTPPLSPGASPLSLCSDGRGLSRIGHIAGAPSSSPSFGDTGGIPKVRSARSPSAATSSRTTFPM